MRKIRFFNQLAGCFTRFSVKNSGSYNYYNSKEDYYRSLLRDDNLTRLSMLLEEHLSAPKSPEAAVKFRGIAFNTFINQVTKKLGKPRFVVDNSSYVKGHKILFYRYKVDKYKTIAQLHFLNGFFFYGKYTFKNLSQADTLKIESTLKSKYFHLSETAHSLRRVKDEANNVLSVEKSLYLNIKYISGIPEFSEQIGRLFMQHLENRKEKEISRIETLRDLL